METTLFQAISKSIESIGVTNTVISACILIVVAYLYYNKDKTNKVLSSTVKTNNQDVLDSINSQNLVLAEIRKLNNELMVAINGLENKVDGFMTLTIGLIQRDLGRNDGDKGGNGL